MTARLHVDRERDLAGVRPRAPRRDPGRDPATAVVLDYLARHAPGIRRLPGVEAAIADDHPGVTGGALATAV